MRIKRVTSDDLTLKKHIQALYLEAFPSHERKPLETIYTKQVAGYCDVLAILEEDDESFVGMIVTVKQPTLILVEYLAIHSDFRGLGYGSKVLALLQAQYKDSRVCLEIEDTGNTSAENYEQRLRRLQFYKTNGFEPLNWVVSFFGTPLEVLGTSDDIMFEEYMQLYEQMHGEGIRQDVYLLEERGI